MTAPSTTRDTSATAAILFKGGPNLFDLLVDAAEYQLFVTGPRMLFERLELMTSLSVYEGGSVHTLRELAGHLEGEVHCGATGVQPAEIGVDVHRTGPSLVIDLGPVNMYQSALVLRTTTGETFRELLQRLFARDPSRPFLAALHGVTATGHHEHFHLPSPGGDGEGGGGGDGDPQPGGGDHGGHAHH